MNDLIISIEDLLDEAKCNKENLVDALVSEIQYNYSKRGRKPREAKNVKK